eukprot:923340-Lingulodinium_polyedra.AAC.1
MPTIGVRMLCVTRAICELLRQQIVDSTTSSCTVSVAVHDDVAESVCRRCSRSHGVCGACDA